MRIYEGRGWVNASNLFSLEAENAKKTVLKTISISLSDHVLRITKKLNNNK